MITPIVPVVIGDDLPTATLWKALWDAGLYVNVALYPAVPPGGSLIRTSVMATHEREHLDRALEIFASVRDSCPSSSTRRSAVVDLPRIWGKSDRGPRPRDRIAPCVRLR